MSIFIAFGTLKTPLDWRDENPDIFQKRLTSAYENKQPVYCGCRDGSGTRLSIRKLGADDNPHYVLARWPKTGLTHQAECPFFGFDPSEDGRLAPGVIKTGVDGILTIRIDPPLKTPTQSEPTEPDGHLRSGPRSQPPIALREMLQLLWEQADLARWDPRFAGKRSAYVVAGALARAANGIKVGKRLLSERLIVITTKPSERFVGAAAGVWDAAVAVGEAVMVAGVLRGVPEEPALGHDRAGLYLHSASGAYKIALDATSEIIAQLRTSFHRELATFAAPEDGRDHVFAIVTVRPRPPARGDYRTGEVVAASLLRVTPAWIPVESALESRIARALVEQGRRFSKPLRYGGEAVQPDFILLDTGEAYPMEVYGMGHAAYVTRKAEKDALYARDFGGRVWTWNAVQTTTPPPFPPRRA